MSREISECVPPRYMVSDVSVVINLALNSMHLTFPSLQYVELLSSSLYHYGQPPLDCTQSPVVY